MPDNRSVSLGDNGYDLDDEPEEIEGETDREKNIRNAAYKRGMRAAKLYDAHKLLKEANHLWEAFNIWRDRAHSAEGKLKKSLRLLKMTEHELDAMP